MIARKLKLSILNTMYYEKKDIEAKDLFLSMHSEKPVFDAIITYSFEMNEEILVLEEEEKGIRRNTTLDPDKEIENAVKFCSGEYFFSQIPFFDIEHLNFHLLPFLNGKKKGTVYVRLYKENNLEEVIQFFIKAK